MKTVQLNVIIPIDLKKYLKTTAVDRDLNLNDFVFNILNKFKMNHEKKVKQGI